MKITGKAVSNNFDVGDAPHYFYGKRLPRTWIMVIDRRKAHVFYKTPSGLELIADALPEPDDQPFAKSLSVWLEKANNRDAFDQLVLVAAPKMLGEFRNSLSEHVRARLVGEIDKDLTNMPVQDIKRNLGNVLYFKD